MLVTGSEASVNPLDSVPEPPVTEPLVIAAVSPATLDELDLPRSQQNMYNFSHRRMRALKVLAMFFRKRQSIERAEELCDRHNIHDPFQRSLMMNGRPDGPSTLEKCLKHRHSGMAAAELLCHRNIDMSVEDYARIRIHRLMSDRLRFCLFPGAVSTVPSRVFASEYQQPQHQINDVEHPADREALLVGHGNGADYSSMDSGSTIGLRAHWSDTSTWSSDPDDECSQNNIPENPDICRPLYEFFEDGELSALLDNEDLSALLINGYQPEVVQAEDLSDAQDSINCSTQPQQHITQQLSAIDEQSEFIDNVQCAGSISPAQSPAFVSIDRSTQPQQYSTQHLSAIDEQIEVTNNVQSARSPSPAQVPTVSSVVSPRPAPAVVPVAAPERKSSRPRPEIISDEEAARRLAYNNAWKRGAAGWWRFDRRRLWKVDFNHRERPWSGKEVAPGGVKPYPFRGTRWNPKPQVYKQPKWPQPVQFQPTSGPADFIIDAGFVPCSHHDQVYELDAGSVPDAYFDRVHELDSRALPHHMVDASTQTENASQQTLFGKVKTWVSKVWTAAKAQVSRLF